jgi:hypothetical protein
MVICFPDKQTILACLKFFNHLAGEAVVIVPDEEGWHC